MSELLNILSGAMDSGAISQLSEKLGMDEEKTSGAVAAALPLLIKALASNTEDSDGAKTLSKALEKNHDGSILEDISGYLNQDNLESGSKILKHVLGSQLPVVEKGLGQMTGMDSSKAGSVISAMAPLVLGAIGKQKNELDLDASGLSSFLNSENTALFKIDPENLGVLGKLLDTNNDGNITDDLADIGGKLLKGFLNR